MGNCLPLATSSSFSSVDSHRENISGLLGEALEGTCRRRRFGSAACSSVLQEETEDVKKYYDLGKELGRGQFGVIRQCQSRQTGESFACKSIAKSKLVRAQDVEDVRREIDIMRKLTGHPNVVGLRDVFEDKAHVHLVMELCEGGELFDRIVARKFFPEKEAAPIFKTLVEVVKFCHEMGVIHRDLKPENILLAENSPSSSIKLADFGLALFFTPEGEKFSHMAGSAYYIAPEVLKGRYSEEADVWSAGVILYILLCGVPPFWATTEPGIFAAIKEGIIDFISDPWGKITIAAKDLITRMLHPNPKARITPAEILVHPWILRHCPQKSRPCCKTEAMVLEEVASDNSCSTEAMAEVPAAEKESCLSEDLSFKCSSFATPTTDSPTPESQAAPEFSFRNVAETAPTPPTCPSEAAATISSPAMATHVGFDCSPQPPPETSPSLFFPPISSGNASPLSTLSSSTSDGSAEPTASLRSLTEPTYAFISPSSSFSSQSTNPDAFDRWASLSQVAEPVLSEFLATVVSSLDSSHFYPFQDPSQLPWQGKNSRDEETIMVDSMQGKFLVVHDILRRRIGWKQTNEPDFQAPLPPLSLPVAVKDCRLSESNMLCRPHTPLASPKSPLFPQTQLVF